MLCPTCKKGTLRVIIFFACGCGHHSLICDKCLAYFDVDHGDPLGPLKLPPEYAVHPAPDLDEARKEAQKEGLTISDDELRAEVDALPTIEECKEFYAELEANPDAFDDDDEGEDDKVPN